MFERVSDYFLSGGWLVDAWEIFCVREHESPDGYKDARQSKASVVDNADDEFFNTVEKEMYDNGHRDGPFHCIPGFGNRIN